MAVVKETAQVVSVRCSMLNHQRKTLQCVAAITFQWHVSSLHLTMSMYSAVLKTARSLNVRVANVFTCLFSFWFNLAAEIPNYSFGFVIVVIFTALHGMQTRSCDEISVCPSVCLSVRPSVRPSNACIVTKRKKNLSRFLYHAKDHSV